MESESKVVEPDNVERPRRVIVSRSGDEGRLVPQLERDLRCQNVIA